MPHYCRHRSRERAHELKGRDPCRACDMRTLMMINEGKEQKDFPRCCQYCTEDPKAAEAEAEAWKKDAENRRQRYEQNKRKGEECTIFHDF
ncbi:MAG: hypothetical protein QXD77_01320 [Candidatus Aenigmatarchaeota archaeon]